MGKVVTYFSVGSSAFAIAFSLTDHIVFSVIICVASLALLFIGFLIERYVRNNGNLILDRIVYFFTKNEQKYNVKEKRIKYSCLGNDSYEFEKKYTIIPQIADLDRMEDRFGWSASSAGYLVHAMEDGHVVNHTRQKEMWDCYTVYFNENAKKHKPYQVTSVVSNLVDHNGVAVPYLSNTIDKKTKSTTMQIIFPKNKHPNNAKFKVYAASGMDSIREENLEYDDGVGGFKKTVLFPRKGWIYVISWEK